MHELLEHLSQQGVQLWVKNNQLSVRAPKGILTSELQALLSQHKTEMIAWLNQNSERGNPFGLNLEAEALLDPQITLQGTLETSISKPNAIFITGATGFLGAFLLHDLLQQTEANLYCLVRAADLECGKKRLQVNLEAYGLWQEAFGHRITPVLGNLTQPKLGFSDSQFHKLAEQIEVIYHSAALLNWVYPYSALKSSNVLGTQEVLRLACHGRVKPVHYVSTVAVFEASDYANQIVTEQVQPAHGSGVYLGYSQSKWVAEKLVLQARDRGLPVCIYRAPFISGHSQTGSWYTDDFVCRMIKGCLEMGAFPDLDYQFEMAPVDYISQGIVYLSHRSQSLGQTFHLMNPQPVHLHQFIEWLQAAGYPVQKIPYKQWLEQLRGPTVSSSHSLKPLQPFFTKRWADTGLTLPELYQQSFKPRFSCQDTLAALSNSLIACPLFDAALLKTYLSYFVQQEFLPSPSARRFNALTSLATI